MDDEEGVEAEAREVAIELDEFLERRQVSMRVIMSVLSNCAAHTILLNLNYNKDSAVLLDGALQMYTAFVHDALAELLTLFKWKLPSANTAKADKLREELYRLCGIRKEDFN
jgi:hypothetical protein